MKRLLWKLGLPCCRRTIGLEKIIEAIADTHGVRNLEASVEQLKNIGINIKCPFCEATLWVKSLPSEAASEIDKHIPSIN